MRKILRDFVLKLFGALKSPESGIHIINSHFISPNKVDILRDSIVYEKFLNFLSQTCRFVTLQEAANLINAGNIPTDEVLLSFTYDDGFEECYTVIAPLLEKYNTRGAFFINANYIGSDTEYQNGFNDRTLTYTKTPMSWDQVIDLHKRGHLIGAHTLDHVDLTKLSATDVDFQFVENKKILEDKLNYNCDYFAWTYGRMEFFSEKLLNVAQKYHKHIFSATDYKNYFSYNARVLNRRHIEAFWTQSHVRFFISAKKQFNK
jgi:peptidoglycan/xylan/chitin deacetylase (PgdA/CDA1 family)